MPFTFTNNPTVGGDSGNWGTILNTILTEIKNACNSLLSSLAGKADSTHNHDSDYPTLTAHNALGDRVTAVENLTSFMNPDLTSVVVSATITDLPGGIGILVETTPSIYARRFNVSIKKAGVVIFTGGGASNFLFIEDAWGFEDEDVLEIQVSIVTGVSSTKASEWYGHTYNAVAGPLENRVAALENTDYADLIANDATARAALAGEIALNSSLRSEVSQQVYNLENPGT